MEGFFFHLSGLSEQSYYLEYRIASLETTHIMAHSYQFLIIIKTLFICTKNGDSFFF